MHNFLRGGCQTRHDIQHFRKEKLTPVWHRIVGLTNQKDDSVQPVIAEDEGNDEEGDAEKDGHAGDEVDEVVDLLGDGRVPHVEARGEAGDPSHDGVVAAADDHACRHRGTSSSLKLIETDWNQSRPTLAASKDQLRRLLLGFSNCKCHQYAVCGVLIADISSFILDKIRFPFHNF